MSTHFCLLGLVSLGPIFIIGNLSSGGGWGVWRGGGRGGNLDTPSEESLTHTKEHG